MMSEGAGRELSRPWEQVQNHFVAGLFFSLPAVAALQPNGLRAGTIMTRELEMGQPASTA